MIASTMTCLLAMMAPATVPSDTPTPNLEALALAPTVGWLMLLAFALVVAIFTVHRETWRRLFLRAEDPRSVAAFRIAFGLMTMANINGLWELFHYLFTDEGLFFADVAQEVFAKDQFEGFGDGIGGGPRGFFDWAAVVEFIKGPKFSLLFFWDSPTAFWLHLAGFWLACTCLIVGYKTKYAKWATFILFNSIILRNQVFWEGTENVYRCFLFYLCLSRCGAAYSVDNWLRCRRLRAQGLLSERDGPGGGAGVAPSPEHPRGLAAVYQLIPAWPRMLMILQVAALYCSTGAVKNGAVWKNGDAFYYALNLDHFYRFEPQQLSAIFGTNLFRINTWVVHWWEACFPLVVLGLVSRFMRREQVPPPPRAALWLGRVCWVLLGLTACAIVYVVLPVHIPRATPGALRAWQQWFPVAWIGGMAMIAGVIMWLRRRPPCVTIRGVRHVLDLDWFCTWFLGRRLWLGLGVIFHAHLIMMMNIGWFTPATLSTYFVFLNGSELAHLLQPLGARLARLGVPMPAAVRRGEPPLPAEDPTLPQLHRDAAALPGWSLYGALGVALVGVYMAVPRETIDESGASITRPGIHWGATGAAIFIGLGLVGYFTARDRGRTQLSRIDPQTGRPRRPWAHAPMGRFLAGALCVYHITGVAIWLLPDKDSLGGEGKNSWRLRAQDPFKWWIRMSQTSQGWKMFAPNPPRNNLMMRVLVTDAKGEVFDLNTDVYHPANKPIPWIFYSRIRKINRRIVGAEGGKGQWYQKWHGRYICRQWALDHGGEAPKQVDLVKVSYAIPTPEEVAKNGPYVPEERMKRTHTIRHVHTTPCNDVNAQLPNHIRERHGLPLLPDDAFKPWVKQRKAAWDKRIAGQVRRGRDPNRFPFVPLTIGLVVLVAGWRWRRLDRDNELAAQAAEAATPAATPPTS